METGRAGRPEARSDLFGLELDLVGVPVEPSAVPLVIIGTGDLGKPAFSIPTVCQCQCHNRTGWFHSMREPCKYLSSRRAGGPTRQQLSCGSCRRIRL